MDAATFAVALNNEPWRTDSILRTMYPETLQAFYDVVAELQSRPTPLPGASKVDPSNYALFSVVHPLAVLRDAMAAHNAHRTTMKLSLFCTPANALRFADVQQQLTALTSHHLETSCVVAVLLWRKLATPDLRPPCQTILTPVLQTPTLPTQPLSILLKTLGPSLRRPHWASPQSSKWLSWRCATKRLFNFLRNS